MSDGTVNFEGNCGECTSGYYAAKTQGGMQPGQSASVNGQSPQNCVIANDSAAVFTIEVVRNSGIYDYQIRVEAQGPSGIGTGSMYLAFQDLTNDVYYLSVYSSRRQWHTVSYNSSQPAIKAIFWSNYSFSVNSNDGASGEKPEYKVESGVDLEAPVAA